jgi:histidine triad (HIT) family protein
MAGCLFCNLISGKTDSKVVYQNDHVFCFEDINPQAPVHVLIVPKKHYLNLNELAEKGEMSVVSEMMNAAMEVAKIKGIDERGFRIVINNNEEGGQIIKHLHLHILGGKQIGGGMAG